MQVIQPLAVLFDKSYKITKLSTFFEIEEFSTLHITKCQNNLCWPFNSRLLLAYLAVIFSANSLLSTLYIKINSCDSMLGDSKHNTEYKRLRD